MDRLMQAIAPMLRKQVRNVLQQHDRQEHRKADGSWVTSVDIAIQESLRQWLVRLHPDVGFLGEEMSQAEQERALATHERLWVLDPLDGTSNFRVGFPTYATTLALIEGGRTVAGWVFDPCRDEMFTASRGHGAWLNDCRLQLDHAAAPPLAQAIAAVDFKRLPPRLAAHLATSPPYASQRSIGSIALDWCWLASGRFAVYLHGKQKLWDYAAGQLILVEAGGCHASLEADPGSDHARMAPRSAVCALSPDLLKAWLEHLRSAL